MKINFNNKERGENVNLTVKESLQGERKGRSIFGCFIKNVRNEPDFSPIPFLLS